MKKLALFFAIILSPFVFKAQTLTDALDYTTAGVHTFTVPACVTQIKVETWGAGGGGGGSSANNEAGGGGGGGAFSRTNIISVVPGEVYTINVGAGGIGGTGGGTAGDGQDGQFSSFTDAIGTILTLANGGSGGIRSDGGGFVGVTNPVIDVSLIDHKNKNPTFDQNGDAVNINAGGAGGTTTGAAVGDDRQAGGDGGAGFKNTHPNHGIGGAGGGSAGRSEDGGKGNIGYSHCYETAAITCGMGTGTTAGGAGPGGGVEGGSGANRDGMAVARGPATNGYDGGGGGGGSTDQDPGADGGAGKVTVYWGRYSTYNATTTWTAPAGITSVEVEAWGAGGGGGGFILWKGGGGGGGGGAYSKAIVSVNPGQTYTLTVGEGGTAGLGLDLVNQSDGGPGGDTWFGDLATAQVLAKGGLGGAQGVNATPNGFVDGGLGGDAAQSIAGPGFTAYSGGLGGKGRSQLWGAGGGGGSSAGYTSDGGDAGDAEDKAGGLRGVPPLGGFQGATGASTYQFAQDASGYGAGGGGAANGGPGARGSNGQIILGYFPSIDVENNSTEVPATNVCALSSELLIHSFIVAGNNAEQCNPNIITDVSFNTIGDYLATDIINYKLYVTTTNVFATTTLLGTITVPTAAGVQTFPTFADYDLASNKNYFWVTADISATAGANRTIGASANTNVDVTTTPVTRLNAGGYGVASASQTFVAAPTLSSGLTPASICSGAAFTYTPTSTTGGATYTWIRSAITDITEAAVTSASSIGETLNNTSPSSIDVTYEYTSSANGCSTVQDVILTVAAVPTGTIIAPAQACLNDPTLPVLSFVGSQGSSNYTFTYSIGGATQTPITSTGTTATITAPNNIATITTYSLISIIEGSGNACSATITGVTASVDIKPPADGALSAAVTRVCVGAASPNIVFTGSNGTAPYSFTYTIDSLVNGTYIGLTSYSLGAAVNTVADPVPTTRSDTLRYIITGVADNSGLVCQANPDTILMIVDPLPLSIISSPGGGEQCLNQPGGVQLDFSALNVVGQVTFNFTEQFGVDYATALAATKTIPVESPIGPLAVGVTTSTIIMSAGQVGTTIYSNGISTSNVCSGSGTGSASITVNPLPTAAISNVSAFVACEDASVVVNFEGSLGTNPYTFTYNINGSATTYTATTLPGQNSVDVSLDTVPGIYTFDILTIVDTYGCTPLVTGTAPITYTVEALPTANTIADYAITCENSTATVEGVATDGNIVWTVLPGGAGTISANSTSTIPTFSGDGPGTAGVSVLQMEVTSDNTCGLSAKAITTATVTTDPLPLAFANGNLRICENSSHVVQGATASYGTIIWRHNGNGTIVDSTSLTPTYIATAEDVGTPVVLSKTVTSDNNCGSEIATASYTIGVDALPVATAGDPELICEDASVNISNAYVANGTILWTVQSGAGSITAGETTLTPTFEGGGVNYDGVSVLLMTVTGVDQCLTFVTTATTTVTTESLPEVSIITSTAITCETSTATVEGGGSDATILWTKQSGDGSITAGETTTTPTFTGQGEGTAGETVLLLTASSNNTCSGATATGTATITTEPLPTSTIDIATATTCENNTAQVSGTPINGNISWAIQSGPGSLIAGITENTVTFSGAGSGTFGTTVLLMTVTSNNSCNNVGATDSQTAEIITDPLPLNEITTELNQRICENGIATLVGAATYGTGRWEQTGGPGTLTNNGLTASFSADGIGTSFFNFIVTSNNTCITSTPLEKYDFIVMDRLPQAIVSQNTPADSVCLNENLIVPVGAALTNDSNDKWSHNGTGSLLNDENNLTPTYLVEDDDENKIITLTLTATSDNACDQETADAFYYIYVRSLPTGYILPGENQCENGEEPIVSLNGRGTKAPYVFNYSFNEDKFTADLTGQISLITNYGKKFDIGVSTIKEAEYTFSLEYVTDGHGCVSDTIELNNTDTITIYRKPYADFILNKRLTTLYEPKFIFEEGSINATSWEWSFGDNTTSDAKEPEEHTYAREGVYNIELKVSNNSGCKDSTTQVVTIEKPTSIYIPSSFTPNADKINDMFMVKGDGIESFEMRIYNRWGVEVFHSNDINIGWDGSVPGSDSGLVDAYVYLVVIRDLKGHDQIYRGSLNVIK